MKYNFFAFLFFILFFSKSLFGYKYNKFYSMSIGAPFLYKSHSKCFSYDCFDLDYLTPITSTNAKFSSLLDYEIKTSFKSSLEFGKKFFGPIFIGTGLSYYSGLMNSCDDIYKFSFTSTSIFLGLSSIFENTFSPFVPYIGLDFGFSRILSDFDLVLRNFTQEKFSGFISEDALNFVLEEIESYGKYGLFAQFKVGVFYELMAGFSIGIGYSYVNLFNVVDYAKGKIKNFMEINDFNDIRNIQRVIKSLSLGEDLDLKIPDMDFEGLLRSRKYSHFFELSTRFSF